MLCGARFTTDDVVSERSTPWQTFMLYYRGIVDATISKQPTVLIDGLRFTEGPRWHDGRLYFSDMHAGEVIADGAVVTACQQACASGAITFGNVKDTSSEAVQKQKQGEDRAYRSLQILNTRPAVTYLAQVRRDENEGAH